MDKLHSLLAEEKDRITVLELNGVRKIPTMAEEVRMGLSQTQKRLSSKYFYDERGSWIFEKICNTPEYYPTRVESVLLEKESENIIKRVKPSSILELGSGSSRKTRYLLDACDRQGCYSHYLPMDVCGEMVIDAGVRFLRRYDWLDIQVLVGDYCTGFRNLPTSDGPRLVVFLGGTFGNFEEAEGARFLKDVRSTMENGDWFLMGADRVKDIQVLNAAYNDQEGLTAQFNLNILKVINRELKGDFNLSKFRHYAFFNPSKSRIEMHLQSLEEQEVSIQNLGMDISFGRGETILTEISRKFTPQTITQLIETSGFRIDKHFEAEKGYFSLLLARPA